MVLYIALIRSYVWNNLTSADSNERQNTKKILNVCYNRFIQHNSICNYETMLNYLHLKRLNYRRQNCNALFLNNIFKNKIDSCSTMDTVGIRVITKKIRFFPSLTSEMSQDLSLEQGAWRLQTSSTNLWTFSINITSPLRIHFPLFNPTELYHCRITCIIVLPDIIFLILFLVLYVTYIFTARLLYTTRCWQHLNKGTEFNYYSVL
jgi:hypothetical protein